MKLSNFFVAVCMAACSFFLSACEDDVNNHQVKLEKSASELSHTITKEKALASLQSFLSETNKDQTRSIPDNRRIKDIFAVTRTSNITRALARTDILYVANFEDNQGFAVLAADDRIKDEVIAVTSEGSLSRNDINSVLNEDFYNRPVVKGYPLTGNGFFTVNEYPDEVFMNPNTVSLYDEKEDDTLVGNFGLDDYGEEDENGNLVNTTNSADASIKESKKMISKLCIAYAVSAIDDFYDIDGGQNNGNSTRTETTTSWSNVKIASPLLQLYKKWNQNTPFNDLYPKKRKYILFGHKRRAPAGCFPLAISKIMTHFERPRYTYNGYTINWGALKNDFYSANGKKSAAHLLRAISSGCDSWYFYAGTFTFPGKATSYMKSIGYKNARSYDYKYSRVTAMIDKGCPLIIYAIPGINIFNSHSWNIDGYKVKVKTTTTKKYVGNVLKSVTNKTDTCNMVHCDFGWGGPCNGYFVSGVFKLNSPNNEFDNPYDKGKNTKYNTLLKIVTYDKP